MIPNSLLLDTVNDTAYISVIGFSFKNFRTEKTPIPFISSFNEINLRTYVTHNGIRGVYFFSLYADKL